MDDLISRQAAIDALMEMTKFKPHSQTGEPTTGATARHVFHMSEILSTIVGLPSAQPEIVRCIGCKWSYDDVSGRICSHGVCVDCVVSDGFYCADAERRTDERSD